MGGCRCVFRTCNSSTSITPGLHYFHFPVRDEKRCEQWIKNARKPMLRVISKEKLRNKVICSLHFEDSCFTNEKRDRLIHSAVPTIGHEDAPEDYASFSNSSDVDLQNENNIMFIPISEDNTKFTLPVENFPGMSYTILADSLVPTATLPFIQEKNSNVKIIVKKTDELRKPKFTVKSINKILAGKREENRIRKESKSNITSYSLTADGDEFMVEPTNNESYIVKKGDSPLLSNDVALQHKGSNEYTISVVNTPVSNVVSIPLENMENMENITFEEVQTEPEIQPMDVDPLNSETEKIVSKNVTPKNIITIIDGPDTIQDDKIPETIEDFKTTPEKEYIRMIKSNSKQIFQLKKLVNKQNRLNKYILQRKQLCKFKRKQFDKYRLLNNLRHLIKPSLMAILKLELLPSEEVILNDEEEKFITDLYTDSPDCYNVLLKKYNWNLPNTED